jgi:hypothetical protein
MPRSGMKVPISQRPRVHLQDLQTPGFEMKAEVNLSITFPLIHREAPNSSLSGKLDRKVAFRKTSAPGSRTFSADREAEPVSLRAKAIHQKPRRRTRQSVRISRRRKKQGNSNRPFLRVPFTRATAYELRTRINRIFSLGYFCTKSGSSDCRRKTPITFPDFWPLWCRRRLSLRRLT